MKWVKTAFCRSLSMDGFRMLNTWMLEFERALLMSKQVENCWCLYSLVHSRGLYHTFAYTVWYVWQLRFLELRQNRKLGDGVAKNGRNFVQNQSWTKGLLCSCAWLKLEIFTSARASRAFSKCG